MIDEPLPKQEAKSELVLFPQWGFKLDRRDSLLVLRALGGRLNNEEERAAASALCDRLTLQRRAMAAELLKGLEFGAEAVLAKGGR